ncbi:ABC transporter ATP-binding protein [Nocardia yamanashiensis]|uniref:ABC transporter ATP-binding protein n=1 Tax=Nocardia yamanashiensis TaxID=209247 RepID=UPI001E4D77EB|nr:ABC transporter ATP-binding protein [Nocardia yamanashiensis]UGT39367.1 ABC transporter ATP-binding protein [Nocardia yamanashiensis]
MSPSTPEPVLQVTGLRRSFGGVHAVDGIDLTVAPGEFVAIIGPNGSGKSTTINLISGVLKPDAGEVLVRGKRIRPGKPEAAAAAGLARTFQNGRVFGNMTVRENVDVGLQTTLTASRPLRSLANLPVLRWVSLLAELAVALVPTPAARAERKATADRIDAQLARFGERLTPRAENPAYTLSYANRRRTEIARALALEPDLLLLDEPAAGMNQTETAEIGRQLAELKAQGQTVLLVEHKMDIVHDLSDRVLVLDEGRVIAEGKPDEVLADPRVIEAYLGRSRVTPAAESGVDGSGEPEAGPETAVSVSGEEDRDEAVGAGRSDEVRGEGKVTADA